MDCKWAATGRWVSRGNRKDNSVSLFPRVSQSTLSLCIKLSVEVSVRFHSPDSLCKLLCAYALELAQAPPSDESTMNLSFYFNLTFTVDWQFINLIISKKNLFRYSSADINNRSKRRFPNSARVGLFIQQNDSGTSALYSGYNRSFRTILSKSNSNPK